MKVLIAPDKFKGSLTAAEVARHLGTGLEQRGVTTRALPLADGGDGSVAAAVATGFRAGRGRRRRGDRRAAHRRDRLRRGHRRRRGGEHLRAAHPARRHARSADVLVGGNRRRGPHRGDARGDADRPGARRLGQHGRRDGDARRPRGGVPRRGGPARRRRWRLPAPHPHRGPRRPARPDAHRGRHRERRAEPADRAGRRRRRLRAAEGRRPGPGRRRSTRGSPTSSTGSSPPDGPTHPGSPPLPERVRPAGWGSRACCSAAGRSPGPTTSWTCSGSRRTSTAATWSSPARDASTTRPCTASCPPSSPGVPHLFR